MTTYTMSQKAIATLTTMVEDHHKRRDGENNIEAVYLIYGYEHDGGVEIVYFSPCPNAHEDPFFYFGVDREDAMRITDAVRAVFPDVALVGCLHTHEEMGSTGPSWEDINAARENTINAVLCAYERSVSFYDDRGFIKKMILHRGALKTPTYEEITDGTSIAQYPFPTPVQ